MAGQYELFLQCLFPGISIPRYESLLCVWLLMCGFIVPFVMPFPRLLRVKSQQ